MSNIRNKIAAVCVWGAAFGAILPAPAAAQDRSAAEAASEVATGMKTGFGFSGITDLVDWEYLYGQMDSSAKEALGVSSAEELRRYNEDFYSHPADIVMRQVVASGENISPEQAVSIARQTEEQIARNNHRLTQAKFTIDKSAVSGNSAVVSMKAVIDNNESRFDLYLRENRGRWLLTQFPPAVELEPPPPDGSGGPKAQVR